MKKQDVQSPQQSAPSLTARQLAAVFRLSWWPRRGRPAAILSHVTEQDTVRLLAGSLLVTPACFHIQEMKGQHTAT